jgi:hypothetical protein
VYFHIGEYKKSLSYISELLTHEGVKTVRAIYLVALYSEALCLNMMGKHELAESRLTNLHRVILAKGNGDADGITEMQLKFIRAAALLDLDSDLGRSKVKALIEALLAEKTDNVWAEFIAPAEWLTKLLKESRSSS